MEYNRRAEDNGQDSLRVMIARIDERVKNLSKDFYAYELKCPLDMKDFDKRIGSLEKDRAKVWGGAAVLSFVIGLVVNWIRGK